MVNNLNILLGRGGQHPGLEAYHAVSGRRETILTLPVGQSVYAIDVSPEGKTIATGTKAGDIYWFQQEHASRENDSPAMRHYSQCAPVLSVRFVAPSILAAADTVGRCLLWQLGEETAPSALPVGKGVIYSLFPLDSRHLAGLSLFGELLVWDWTQRNTAKILEVPMPADCSALVKPVYWPMANQWIWPAQEGVMVFYRWQRDEIRVARAHDGDVYAGLVCNEQLLTIGRTDGCLKYWRPGTDKPAGTCDAPCGVVSAASWGEREFPMVLVDDAGVAGLYSWDGGQVRFAQTLPGQDYRIAFGPDQARFRLALREYRTARARALTAQAQEQIEQRQWHRLDPFCRQLKELGFAHAALALSAQEARAKHDLLGELRAYHEMAQIIPHERSESQSSLQRYAELLEAVWRMQEANSLRRHLLDRELTNAGPSGASGRLAEYARIIAGGSYVIEPEIPLTVLVEAAMVLGEPFVGRYLVRSLEPPVSCLVHLSTGEFISRFEQVSGARPQGSPPHAEQMRLWWLSRDGADHVTTAIIRSRGCDGLSRLEFGVNFFNAGLQTVLSRAVVFNADRGDPEVPIAEHNRSVLQECQRLQNGHLSERGWLQMVHRDVKYAIRQLITKGCARRGQERG